MWFCPHGFKTKRRKEEIEDDNGKLVPNAEPSHFFYADCDGVDPRLAKLKPTMVIESSPGRYVGLWYVGEPVPKLMNQAWTQLHKYDPGGWDPTQVLRPMGSRNHKYSNKPLGKRIPAWL